MLPNYHMSPLVTDAELFAGFEAARLAPAEFGHREHVRCAYVALARRGDLAAAAVDYRTSLRRLAAALGAPDRYHETLTWAYLVLIQQRMRQTPCADSLDLLARHPDLLDHRAGALARYYDVPAITASPEARAWFVLPEPR